MEHDMARHCALRRNNERKKSRDDTEEEEMVLDSRVWAALPDSIFFTVSQFLAWDDAFRFRVVHKEWNLFLRSSIFKTAWRRNPDQEPFCIASSSKINSYFNPATRRWHVSGVDLPPSLSAAKIDIFKNGSKNTPRGRRFPVVSAAKGFLLIQMYTSDADSDDVLPSEKLRSNVEIGGLKDVRDDFMVNSDLVDEGNSIVGVVDVVAQVGEEVDLDYKNGFSVPYRLQEHDREMLLVVNPLEPLTKACVKMVPYLQDNYCQHEIIWDPKLCKYELLARSADISQYRIDGNCVWSIIFHRFDFSAGVWTKIVSWSTHRFISLESSCLIGGQLVCLGRPATLRSVNTKPYRIYGMELSQTLSIEEMELIAPELPFSLGFAILFYYKGMYMVAGGDVSSNNSTLRSFKVWQKKELFCPKDEEEEAATAAAEEWTEVIQMPKHLLLELNNCELGSQFTCKTNGRFLCVANRCTDVVMCDLERDSWWRLPAHPRGKDAASEGLALCDPRFDVRLR